MSNLTDLVPPLNLCKLIPAGEFQDSALVWRVPNSSFPLEDEFYEIHRRDKCESWMKDKQIPAPTLQEIMEAIGGIKEISYPDQLNPGRTLSRDPRYEPSIEYFPGKNFSWRSMRWTTSIWEENEKSATAAALRTYLGIKKVEVTMPCPECRTWMHRLGDDQYTEEFFDNIRVPVTEVCPKCGYKYYDGFLLHIFQNIEKHLIYVNTPMGSRWKKKQSDQSETSDLSDPAENERN